jgi:hypothetical protein
MKCRPGERRRAGKKRVRRDDMLPSYEDRPSLSHLADQPRDCHNALIRLNRIPNL